MSTAVAGTPADHRPAPAWVRWAVRGLLAAAVLAAVVVVGRLVAQWRTTLGWLSADGRLESQRLWHADQIAWSVAALVAGLGLGWALVSSLRRRLRRRSWMPVVCLLLVLGMAGWVAFTFQPPVA